MEKLNNKIKNGRTELINDAQMVGLYGYDATADRLRRLTCDTTGKLNIEATLELDSSTLNKEATQLEVKANQTNGTQQSKCMGGETDGTQKQILVSNLGVVQTLDSEVFGKTSQIANQTTLSNTNEATIIANQTNGTQKATVGNTIGDGSGTAKHLKTNADGELLVNLGSSTTQNVNLIANESRDGSGTDRFVVCNTNGFIKVKDDELETNFVSGLFSTQMMGRTTITDSATRKNLLCDADGHLQVDVVSGGGGGGSSSTNLYPTLASITTATGFAGGVVNSAYIDLTNAKNVLVNCIHTGDATARTNFGSDVSISMEFTDDDTNTICYSGAGSPVFGFGTINAIGNSTGFSVAVLSLGENNEASGQITGKFARISVVNNDNSGTATAYNIDFKVVIAGI